MRTAVFLVKKLDLKQSIAWLRSSDVLTTKMLINLNCLIWCPFVLDSFLQEQCTHCVYNIKNISKAIIPLDLITLLYDKEKIYF